jgi:DNA-binding NarL/FixJ family response regulator
LSEYIDENIVTEAIKSGADGFIVKDKAGSEDLIAAIYSLHNEGCYLHPCITKFVIDKYRKPYLILISNATIVVCGPMLT